MRRFISSSLVWRCPSDGRLFLRASSRKEVHCCTMFISMNTSTICVQEEDGGGRRGEGRGGDRGEGGGEGETEGKKRRHLDWEWDYATE